MRKREGAKEEEEEEEGANSKCRIEEKLKRKEKIGWLQKEGGMR
jgi:hypothetical protein